MSDRDILDEAFAALREEHTGASDSARATRQRILLASAGRTRRRSVLVKLVLPIAAVLALSTAWAAITGRLFAPAPPLTPTAPAREQASPSPSPPPAPRPPVPAEPVAPSSIVVDELPDASAAPAPRAPSRPPNDPEEAAYRAAHTAHFVERQPARALAAWEAYLAAYPNGRFAPEARYNRGISLIRLGRTSEAREALRPFADAKPGSYRQAEAKQLVDALGE